MERYIRVLEYDDRIRRLHFPFFEPRERVVARWRVADDKLIGNRRNRLDKSVEIMRFIARDKSYGDGWKLHILRLETAGL